MSSGNKLSISICDDNGNLSYQKQFSVRRIIKRGVVRSDFEEVCVDKNIAYGVSTGDYAQGTHKLVLIAAYCGVNDNETEILTPLSWKKRTGSFLRTYTLYSNPLKKTLTEQNSSEAALGIIIEHNDENYEQSAICNYGGLFERSIHEAVAIRDVGIKFKTYLFGGFQSRQRLRGKRWLAIIPLENIYEVAENHEEGDNNPLIDANITVLFKQNTGISGIKYYIVEVE